MRAFVRNAWFSVCSAVCLVFVCGACSSEETNEPRPFEGALAGAMVSPSAPLSEAAQHADELCKAFSDTLRRLVSVQSAAGYCQQAQFVEAAFSDAGVAGAVDACESAEEKCLSATNPTAYTLCPMLLFQSHGCSVPLSAADACYADYIPKLVEFWNLSCGEVAELGDQLVPLPDGCTSIAAECSVSVRSLRPWSQ